MATRGFFSVGRYLLRLVRPRSVKTLILILAVWLISGFFFYEISSKRHGSASIARQVIEIMGLSLTDRASNNSGGDNNERTDQRNYLRQSQQVATTISDVTDNCKYPVLDPFEPAVIALTKYHPPINCEKGVPHLVYMSEYTIKVNHSRTALYANTTHPFKECRYKSIVKEPGSDFNTIVIYTSECFKDEITPREIDDNLVVECLNTNNTVISRSYFTLIRVKFDLELELESKHKKHLTLNSPKEVLNVLMIGLDGNSKQNMERHMPKTRNFLLNELKALELHKYNKFGDSTYPNVIPLMTGKTIFEIERDNWRYHHHFDFINDDFLWSDFRKVGYRTGVFLDDDIDTPFHFGKTRYNQKGWNKSPVDYYMRATVLERNKDKLMSSPKFDCVGDIAEITSNLDFWIQMASTFNNSKTKPYFGFSFSTHLTHDDHNLASAGDHLYLQFFQEMRDKKLINNTVIVFYSDHGERFGNVRSTYNGMLESKMPHIFLVFPPWFHQKYPELMKVLKINQERLTTNRDVHATIRDLVNFQATTTKGDLNKTGISLFYEIPRERTCEHAEITTEYCLCHQMTADNFSTSMVLLLAEGIQQRLRELTQPHRDKCEKLVFQSTKSLMKIKSDTVSKEEGKEDTTLYQMTIVTKPGGAIYEATLKFNNSTQIVEVIGGIMRLNMYRGQVECIDDKSVQPFCFCKKYTNLF